MEDLTERPRIVDFSITGEDTLITEEQAFVNSLKLWISSYRGDFINGNTIGGYVTKALNRKLDNSEIDLVHAMISEGLKKDFSPQLEITRLEITPNYSKRRWEIELEAFVSDLNFKVFVKENIRELKQ